MGPSRSSSGYRCGVQSVAVAALVWLGVGCARMPYVTHVIHEDPRLTVDLQHMVDATTYTHPVRITPKELAAILRGYSVREQQHIPMRWFEEERPLQPLFRPDEIDVLVDPLSEALAKAHPHERVAFRLRAPGNNPAHEWNTTAGWIGVRDHLFHLEIDYFHVLTPKHRFDAYDTNYSTAPPPKQHYLLYFDPGRFWGKQPGFDKPVLLFKAFLQSDVGSTVE